MKRFFEMLPGTISWCIIFGLLLFIFFSPLVAAVILIVFLLYWIFRLLYMSVLLVAAHSRMNSRKRMPWLKLCKEVKSDLKYEEIMHVVLYPTYKEPPHVLQDSLNALVDVTYPKDKIMVVLAGEEREEGAFAKLDEISRPFKSHFKDIVVFIHPKDIPGELAGKGANATYSARMVKELLEKSGVDLGCVIISTFDADTCPDKKYFACLTYHFLSNPKRYQTSFQPLPIYSNNIYKVSALARVIEIGSTFWQLIESMRYEKFVTFSSHSMSFKTLVEAGYWPVDLVSDDSLIFWKCFLKFDGKYSTYPLEVPVYMDIAAGKNIFETIVIQYRQKRRWAWGVENFVFVGMAFLQNKRIPWIVKFRKLYQLLDNHVNWATWAIIISFMTPLILYWGKVDAKNALVLFNLSYLNGVIFNSLFLIVILSIFISRQFLPPKPKKVSKFFYITFVLQWLMLPFISAALGSIPALDAQTRLMFKRYMGFYRTPKIRQD